MTGEPLDRRTFFRKGFRDFAHTLVKAKEALAPLARQTSSEDDASPLFRLRPPGAVEEEDFLERCTRCDLCFNACPVECLQRVPDGMRDAGTPFVKTSQRACALCTDLSCTKACPEGALLPLESRKEIQMGMAEIREFACIAFLGTTCRACHDICPTLPRAITLQNSQPQLIPDLCIGCGLCEQTCPTQPKAIVVRDLPRDQWHARQDVEEKEVEKDPPPLHAKSVPSAPTDRRVRPVPAETETEPKAFTPSSLACPRAATWLALGVPLSIFGVLSWLQLISGASLSLLEPGFQLSAFLKDLVLLLLFILPHSFLSRGFGRRILNRPFGPCGERPLYVFISGVTLVLLTQLWETTGPVLWDLNDWPHLVARCVQAVGLLLTTWAALVVGSTLLIGIPHLKELRRGGEVPSTELIALAPYSRIRQPINLGILLMLAGMTEVTADRLMLGLLTALWIFLAAPFEERDAALEFGKGYKIYLSNTPRWIPKKTPSEE